MVIATVFMSAKVSQAQAVKEGLVSYWTFNQADIKGSIKANL